jgi:hypothetical protein
MENYFLVQTSRKDEIIDNKTSIGTSKIEVPIEGGKNIEDHVTQWQEFITIKLGQEQEDPDSQVSVKIHLDTCNNFIVSFVDEQTGYMWIYRMKNKDEMPKVIKKWMIDAYEKEHHNFRHGVGAIEERQCQQKAHSSTVSGLGRV